MPESVPKGHNELIEDVDNAVAPNRGRESFLRQVLDINPNLIFAKDRAGRFTLVNKTLADIYGTTVEDLIGKTDADFNPNENEVAFFRRIDLHVMDSQQEVVIPEEVITDTTGKERWLHTVKRPIIGPDGVAHQVLGVGTDITQRRELEAQLRQAQKMEAIGQLAGGVAHDFNNLLAVVMGNTERMLKHVRTADSPEHLLVDGLELILSAGERAAILIRQLLAFSRTQPIAPVVLDVNDIVAKLADLLRRLIGEQITFTVDGEPDLPCVRMDRGQLEQVLVNLAVNARDAMPTGGRLSIATAKVNVDDQSASSHPGVAQGCYVTLSVSDTGVGMSRATLRRIFEPFFTTKPIGKGTGLGLSTLYAIVNHAGGHVTVNSRPGKGSEFLVYLPAVGARVAAADADHRGEPLEGRETVLVCEDEEEVLRLTCAVLVDHGYRVLPATTGPEAIGLLQETDSTIDLLLTDVIMPEMNGRQLADAVRARCPDVKVLFMTGYSADVLKAMHGEDERDVWISKPFSSRMLLKSIRELLRA